MDKKRSIRISVRNLVEFLLRSGDLSGGEGRLRDREAMLAGGRIHRKLQGRKGAAYRAEVSIRETISFDDYQIIVEGRADGIETDSRGTVIEEIKGIYQDVSALETPVPVHLAQAKCYACIYARQHELEKIRIRMVYCHLETEELRTFTIAYTAEGLGEWFGGLIREYQKWAVLQLDWEDERNQSIAQLEFPFPYRAGQRDMVVAAYRTICQGRQLFVQAPTGVGKTLSAVFPAVRALKEGRGEKIFYLTAKTVARTVAEEAFSILRENGLRCKALTLTAKEKICVCDEVRCDPEYCPRAKGHFDRINDALYGMLTSDTSYDRESVLEWSRQFHVCPYEMQLDLAGFADAVICDYNYVFDPAARLSKYFGEGAGKETAILLIDEAHNLIERGREMFSADLEKEEFLALRKTIKGAGSLRRVDKALTRCNKILVGYRKDCLEDPSAMESYGSRIHEVKGIEELIIPLMQLAGALETVLKDKTAVIPQESEEDLLAMYFRVSAFLNTYSLLDDHYLIYAAGAGRNSFRLKLYCVDPSASLQEVLDKSAGTVFFSATMLPMKYYESLLTTEEDNYRIMIPSPFDAGRRFLAIGTDVSTRYRQRGEAVYKKMASYIRMVTASRKGNYMVYFPSYRMLEDVLEAYRELDEMPDQRVLAQEAGMREEEREQFLEAFSDPAGMPVLGMCVMGGIFAEGIDLTGRQLIGAIVVGTGLPQVSGERELLRKWHDRHQQNGFDYAYRFPGLNKVLQAAGRVIRTPEDEGVIVLLDERFCERQYAGLFPADWTDRRLTDTGKIEGELATFWDNL